MSSVNAECKEKKTVSLVSSDGEIFVVEEAVALQSETIKRMMEDGCAPTPMPLPEVTSTILAKLIEYCKRLAATSDSGTSSDEGLKESLKDLDLEMLPEIILGANCLSMKRVVGVLCETVADKIKDFSTEEYRELFDIKNDFTEEEEKQIRDSASFYNP